MTEFERELLELQRAQVARPDRLAAAVDDLQRDSHDQAERIRRAVECVENQFELARHEAVEDLMDRDEAARFLRMAPKTLLNKTSAGEIPSVKVAGTGRRWSRRELTAWAHGSKATRKAQGESPTRPLLRAL